MYFIGLGIAVVCGIIAFAVKDFPPALSWGGVAFGVVFVLWERLPLDPKYNGVFAMAAASAVLAIGATAWAISIARDAGSAAPPNVSLVANSGGLGQQGRIAPKTESTISRPSKLHSQADIERITSELFLLGSILDKAHQLSPPLEVFLEHQPQQIAVSMTVEDARAEALALEGQVRNIVQALNQLLDASAYDRKELFPIVAPFKDGNDPLNRISDTLHKYIEALGTLSASATSTEIFSNRIIWDRKSQLQSQQQALPRWISGVRKAMGAEYSELQRH